MAFVELLPGHTTQETAYLVEDYPYGFRLRCQIRYWLEYRKGHGFRLMSQTSNPKRPGLVWNKPKGSTYAPLGAMYLNEEGHVEWDNVHYYNRLEAEAFYAAHDGAQWNAQQQSVYQNMLVIADAYEARKAARLATAQV